MTRTKKVNPPPSQSQLSGGSGNNMAEPAWKNWFADLHSTLDENGLLEEGGNVKGYPYMKYSGNWVDRPYGYNEVVVDSPWTVVCQNKNGCYSRPTPDKEGDPETCHPGLTGLTTQQFVGLVKSGHDYVFNTAGEVTTIEVRVPEVTVNTFYDLYIIDMTDPDTPKTTRYNDLQLTANTWTSVVLGGRLVTAGDRYSIVLYSKNVNPGTTFDGGWTRGANSNNAEPVVGAWNRTNDGSTIRVNYTDLDSLNKQSELNSVIPGSTIFIENTANNTEHITYGVTNTIDLINSVSYGVVSEGVGPGGEPPSGATCRITYTVPIPSTTKYTVIPDGWSTQPSFATATGLFEEGGVSARGPTDIYGIRITFQNLQGNPTDWGFIAYSSQ